MVVLFAARFCVTAMRGPPADGDLAWQRWLGEQILTSGKLPTSLGAETFTAAGSPWLPQEWLFGILVAVAQRFTLAPAFDLAVALCAVCALVLLARRATVAGASPLATTLCVLFAGIAMLDSFGVRAQVAGWPLLAIFVALLEREASWLLCGAVVVVWSNVHAGAVLAPVLAGAWSAGLALRDRAVSPAAVRAALVTVAALFATAMNPFGFGLLAYAVGLLRSPIKGFIREWQPTGFGDASFVWGALPLLAGRRSLGSRRRQACAAAVVRGRGERRAARRRRAEHSDLRFDRRAVRGRRLHARAAPARRGVRRGTTATRRGGGTVHRAARERHGDASVADAQSPCREHRSDRTARRDARPAPIIVPRLCLVRRRGRRTAHPRLSRRPRRPVSFARMGRCVSRRPPRRGLGASTAGLSGRRDRRPAGHTPRRGAAGFGRVANGGDFRVVRALRSTAATERNHHFRGVSIAVRDVTAHGRKHPGRLPRRAILLT